MANDKARVAGEAVDRIMDKLWLIAAGEDNDAMMITCAAFAGLMLEDVKPMEERRAAWTLMAQIMREAARVKFPKKKAKLYVVKPKASPCDKPSS